MSGWLPNGRYSPFGFYNPRGPPRVTEDDFSYLSGEDDRHRDRAGSHSQHHHHHQPHEHRHDSYSVPRHGSRAEPPDLDPDVLSIKHKGTEYRLHFPAFSIAESLKVGALRQAAAKATNCTDPRRVKLLYKGRSLRSDTAYCRDEGLKQNSELICVISSDTPLRNPNEDGNESSSSSSASSAAIAQGVELTPSTTNEEERRSKRKNHRGGGKRKDKERRENNQESSASQYRREREPSGAGSSTSHSQPHLAPPSGQSRDRSPSVIRSAPKTPAEKIDAITTTFHQDFLPKVQALIAHPPSDPKTRAFEAKKLSEGILMQVLFKLDAVETDDETVKAKRKEGVREANKWSSELDRIGGEKS